MRLLRAALVFFCDVVVRLPPTRLVARAVKSRELALLRHSEFDRTFYLKQIRSRRRQRAAAADAPLHYVLIGWRESRSPSLCFDPVFYRARNSALKRNPFIHFLSCRNEARVLQNETDASPRVLSNGDRSARCVLIFHHARGGGSTKFLTIYETALISDGYTPVRLRKVAYSDRLVILEKGGALELHDLVDDLPGLHRSLSTLRIERILVSHVVDFDPRRIFDIVLRTGQALSSPIDVILHDYLCVCPRINLVNDEQSTCLPIPDVSRCRRCLDDGGGSVDDVDPSQWRRRFADFLESADRVIVPSGDMKQRLAPHLSVPLVVWQPERDTATALKSNELPAGEMLRIVVVGGLNLAKGSKVLAELGKTIQSSGAPVQIELIGDSPDHAMLSRAGIKIHGRFKDEDLTDLLRERDPHVAFLPAIWPETWSFVLTQLLACGLPVFSFDLGAQSERLRALGQAGFLLDTNLINHPVLLLDIFLRYRSERVLKPE